jgi:hypothetical protein
MKGVVLWAHHIHAIHSRHPILRSTKRLGQPKKKLLPTYDISTDGNSMIARRRCRLFIQLHESICVRFLKVPKGFPIEFPNGGVGGGGGVYPCHRGNVNERCGFVGTPHPRHASMAPHPTVYETTRATWGKTTFDG